MHDEFAYAPLSGLDQRDGWTSVGMMWQTMMMMMEVGVATPAVAISG